MSGASSWARAYRTPLWLGALFVVMLALFAVTPDPITATSADADPTAEPTSQPRQCVVCPIDQRCDARSGRCMFVEHTPLPCVKSAKFDEEAGFCLPEGAPPAPAVVNDGPERPTSEFPGGIGGDRARQPRLPGFGNNDDDDRRDRDRD
jgi:hypothetical protein